jgi:hypothetical protein
MNLHIYLDIMAALIAITGTMATASNILLAVRRNGFRRILCVLNALACLYLVVWYAMDLAFITIDYGAVMVAAIRPDTFLIASLFLAGSIAGWNARA